MSTKNKWLIVAFGVLAFQAMTIVFLRWDTWFASWVGAAFKALSGGVLGWGISRYALGCNLSELPAAQRPTAAVSQAILIAAFSIAVALGA